MPCGIITQFIFNTVVKAQKYTKENAMPKSVKEKSLFRILFSGVFRYVVFSILISLFFENTLFWTFLNTAGVTAWVMHRIAMNGRTVLPFRLWFKQVRYGIIGKQFDREIKEEKEQWEKIQAYEQYTIENPFVCSNRVWISLVVPVAGSLLLQVFYFTGLDRPVPPGLLAVWVGMNILLTLCFSLAGAGLMRFVLYLQEKDISRKHENHKKKTDTRWIDRLVAIAILATYLSLNVLPAVIPVHAADCSKKKQSVNEFMECYDREKDYQPHTEPVVTWYDANGVPIKQGGSHDGGNAEEYELAYYNKPEKELNLFEAAWKGITGMQRDLAGIVKRDGGNALKYLEQNWNNPGKLISDYGKVRAEYNKAYQQGLVDAAASKGKSATGIMDSIGKWFQGEWNQLSKAPLSYIRTSTMEIAGWYDTKVVQPAVSHVQNVAAAVLQNPAELLKLGNILLAPAAHITVAIQNNYPGGTKQLYTDTAEALADKETYWNILKSPYSETTQKLFEEGKYVQASGRASAEASVEGAQEAGENLLTFGGAKVGKVGVLMLGFAVDASKYGGRTDKLADTIENIAKYQDNLPTAQEREQYELLKKYYEAQSREIFASDARVEHILKGDKTPGKTGGFHLESQGDSNTYVIPGSESPVNSFGVYEAEVVVNGNAKKAFTGKSTFFPKKWTDQDVINAINEAYTNKVPTAKDPNVYRGRTKNGMMIEIVMERNGSDKIWTAYPIYK